MRHIRRVVTGHKNGAAVIASDEQVPELSLALARGITTVPLWGAVRPPVFPDDGSPTVHPSFSPNPGGYHFSLFSVPPMAEQASLPMPADFEEAVEEMQREVPGLLEVMESDTPGMHRTNSIDFVVMLSGELTLDLGDGVTTVLYPGDTIVQNATRHRWLNYGAERAWAAAVVLGAEYIGSPALKEGG